MNINELLKDLIITEEYKNQICKDNNLKHYIDNKVFTSVFNEMVKFLKPFPVVRRKFIDGYTNQPEACNKINCLLFSPLEDNLNATRNKWIARMPLQQNTKSVLIYFPRSIIVPSNENKFKYEHINPNYHYSIPVNISDFITHPQQFISVDAIRYRLG